MPTNIEIVKILNERQESRQMYQIIVSDIAAMYNHTLSVKLPETKIESDTLPNTMKNTVDQQALRVAAGLPTIDCESTDQGKRQADSRARQRKRAHMGAWDDNRMGKLLEVRAKHLPLFGSSPVTQFPDVKTGKIIWRVKDPRQTFPSENNGIQDLQPANCIFVTTRTLGWLRRTFPMAANIVNADAKAKDTALVRLIEYVDAKERILLVDGDTPDRAQLMGRQESLNYGMAPIESQVARVSQVEVRLDSCPVVIPDNYGIDSISPEYLGMPGMYRAAATLWALNMEQTYRSIFPAEWLEPLAIGATPRIMVDPEPMSGIIGEVQDGRVQTSAQFVNQTVMQMVDRLERDRRIASDNPAEFDGESGNNIRTARRGAQVLSSAISFKIAGYQRSLSDSLKVENQIQAQLSYNWFKDRTISYHFIGWNNEKTGKVTYVPGKIWEESIQSSVKYTHEGMDPNGQAIHDAQMVALGAMSTQTLQERSGAIVDPEKEHDRIVAEALERSMFQSFGNLSPMDISRIRKLVKTNQMDLDEAMAKVQEEAQERQSTAVEAGDPLAQPGLAEPGTGEEAPIIERNSNVASLRQFAQDFRVGQNQSPAERTVSNA